MHAAPHPALRTRLARLALLPAALALAGAICALPAQAEPVQPAFQLAQQEKPALIDTLKDLVSIESGSKDIEGLDRIANLLSAGGDRQAELDATIDIRAELPRIRAQTLVIGMQQDRLVPPAHCRDLAAGIAGARYEQIDCGHLVTLEQPGALLDLGESHLDSPTGHCHEERHGGA